MTSAVDLVGIRCHGCMVRVAVSRAPFRARMYCSALCAELPAASVNDERDDIIVALRAAGRGDKHIADIVDLSRSGAQRVAGRAV